MNEKLNELVASGKIKAYTIVDVDCDGNVGKESANRNSQRLVLFFDTGQTLTIDCCCSGCLENTTLKIS